MFPDPAAVMFIGVIFCLLVAVSNVIADPKVTPAFQTVSHPAVAVVNCVFEQPLNDCLVRVSDQTTFRDFDFVLDFSRGAQSESAVLRSYGGQVRSTASYAGAGLAAGHCGLAMNVESGYLVILIECLGRNDQGDWHRGISLMTTTHDAILPTNTSTSRLIVAEPGSDIAVHLTAQGALRECYVTSPGAGKGVFSPGYTLPPGSRYEVHGAGASAGECGGTLTNLQDWDSGVWYWRAYQGSQAAWQATVVIVSAGPSEDPVLYTPDLSALQVNDLLNATCRAPPSIPPSKLTWLIDGQLIRRDNGNETSPYDVGTALPWHAQSAVQTLSYRMTLPDFGKRLECRATHQTGTRSVGHDLPMIRESPSPSRPNPILTKPSAPPPTTPGSNSIQPSQNASATNVLALDVPKPSTASPVKNGCPALSTSSVTVSCLLAGARVDCVKGSSPLGTVARIECREGYKPQENHPGVLNASCTTRGWRPRPIGCFLDCGRRRGGATQLVVGGSGAKESEFPWHVAVFRKQLASYQPICGGSLVTLRSFVSAAHCFWDETTGTPQNASRYMSSVGKHTLVWTTRDKNEQRRSIAVIHIPAHFAGNTKRLESDIALVEFSAPVDVTPAVNVVCVDWKTAFQYQQLTANSLGTVPGWGITETNAMSPTLRFVELPFVPFIECRDSVPWDFKNYLTIDKFCGGYRNRSVGVCQGDSGGGFVFPAQKLAQVRYYLRGIVSSAPFRGGTGDRLCQAEYRSAFTLVSTYVDWLEELVFSETELD